MCTHCYMNVLVFSCAQRRDSSMVVEIRKRKRDRKEGGGKGKAVPGRGEGEKRGNEIGLR